MFNPKLYREACRELKAPEDKIEEVIEMTEQSSKKKRRPLRTALIAVAAAAMMVVGVSAANPDMVEDFAGRIANIIQVNQYRMEMTTEDGMTITVFSAPQASVENRDGRAILVIDGEDTADITDELNAEERFYYESVTEEGLLAVTVEGTVEDWVASVTIGDPNNGPVYTYFSDGERDVISSVPAAFSKSMGDVDVYVSIHTSDSDTLNEGEISSGTVEYDGETGAYTYTPEN